MKTMFVLSFKGIGHFEPEDHYCAHSVYSTEAKAELGAIKHGKNLAADYGEVPAYRIDEVDYEE